MQINPLDTPGVMFEIELSNPNPSSSKPKSGPVYRVSFEVSKEVHDAFMASREGNLRLIGRMAVLPDTDEQPAHDAIAPTEKPKKVKKPKEPTPHGAMWEWLLHRNKGFEHVPGVREALDAVRDAQAAKGVLGYEDPHALMRKLFGVESLAREVGPAEIYARFPPKEFPAVKPMVEQAMRQNGKTKNNTNR